MPRSVFNCAGAGLTRRAFKHSAGWFGVGRPVPRVAYLGAVLHMIRDRAVTEHRNFHNFIEISASRRYYGDKKRV